LQKAASLMKTVFIVLDLGIAIRNVLRTDIFRGLQSEKDLRIVIFSPIVDEDFRKEFERPGVIVDKVPKWKPNWIVKIARSFKKDIWIEGSEVQAFRMRRLKKQKFVRNFFIRLLRRMSSKETLFSGIEILNSIEAFFTPPLCRQLFEKYKPDLVFYTNLYAKDPCIEIEAQKRKIKTICLLLSWDNPTTKGPFPVKPDKIIVWNEILKDEIVTHHQFDPDKVLISGAPQFDIYSHGEKFRSREDFFKKWGLDPMKKLLTYTTGSPQMILHEPEVVEILYNALQNNMFVEPSQILLRLHPKDIYNRYDIFEGKPGIKIQMPGRSTTHSADKWNPTLDDMYGLAELMHYSDVIINVASTITLDAACFDTPVVNVAFDGYHQEPYNNSYKRYYDYEHYRNVVSTKGIRIAHAPEEMIQMVNLYLSDQSLDAEGRQRLRDELCWKLDGQAGNRIAQHVLDYLHE
jgi:hypothetical protein